MSQLLLDSQGQPVSMEAFPLMYGFTRSMVARVIEHNQRQDPAGIIFETSTVALISDEIIVMTLRCIPEFPLESGTPFSLLGRNVVVQENKVTGILIARMIENWYSVDAKQMWPFANEGLALTASTTSEELDAFAKAIAEYLLGGEPLSYNV